MKDVYVSSKGQIVIPEMIKDAAGLKVGTRLKVALEDGRIVLTPMRAATADDL